MSFACTCDFQSSFVASGAVLDCPRSGLVCRRTAVAGYVSDPEFIVRGSDVHHVNGAFAVVGLDGERLGGYWITVKGRHLAKGGLGFIGDIQTTGSMHWSTVA